MGDSKTTRVSHLSLDELRRLLRQLGQDRGPDPMLPRLLEMFRQESRKRR